MRELELNALLGELHTFASFHDAKFHTVHIDYKTRILEITCTLLTGDPDAPQREQREATADGTLLLSGLLYCAIQPPDTHSDFEEDGPDISSNGSVATTQFKSPLPALPVVPNDAFVHWFFATNWNAFLFVAATDARFLWK